MGGGEAGFESWVGRREERVDWITPTRVATWNATLDRERPFPKEGDIVPPAFHWTLFPPLARESELGADGHRRTGGFLSPVPLPRRMWAGSRLVLHQPFRVGERVEQHSVVTSMEEKHGRKGRLVFVTIRHSCSGANGLVLDEEQDLVYREPVTAGVATSTDPIDVAPLGEWRREIDPTASLLFRYSALTFNGHRIHYDRRYAEGVEGYGGLVVHAPLIATMLIDLVLRQMPDSALERFSFKALRPTFDTSPFSVHGTAADDDRRHFQLWSTDNQGQTAVEANAWIR